MVREVSYSTTTVYEYQYCNITSVGGGGGGERGFHIQFVWKCGSRELTLGIEHVITEYKMWRERPGATAV